MNFMVMKKDGSLKQVRYGMVYVFPIDPPLINGVIVSALHAVPAPCPA